MCFSKKPKKPQVVKFDQNLCNASVDDNDVLFVRVDSIVTQANAIVEVPYTHNALIIKGGGDMRFLKSGNYPVFDDQTEIENWQNGLSVQIIYMPKETNIKICWGTPTKMLYRDRLSQKVIEVGAAGEFNISICNHEQFFRKIVGASREFDREAFEDRFRNAVVDEFADVFLHIAEKDGLTYDRFDANRKAISSKVGKALSEKFEESWGIALVDFIITSFKISDDDKAKVDSVSEEEKQRERMKEYLAELERLEDKQWEREKYLLELEQSDKRAYYEVLKVIGADKAGNGGKGAKYCPNCGHSMENTAAFCPNCGKKAADSESRCPKCKKPVKGDAAFCPSCGEKLK